MGYACRLADPLLASRYIALSSIQAVDSYRQGHTIFIGKRKMLAKRVSGCALDMQGACMLTFHPTRRLKQSDW